jgi:uncharacterized protein (DUF2252 family)
LIPAAARCSGLFLSFCSPSSRLRLRRREEAFPLPYTNDLVRLAASVKIAAKAGALKISLRDACDAIMEGYRATLRKGGAPITLAEEEHFLQTSASRS